MVFKKRQDYNGFYNFLGPVVPKAPRSARKRGRCIKKVDDSEICAFELLASLAGKLLQESESTSSASSNASEMNDQPAIGDGFKHELGEDKPLKIECIDQGSCEESAFFPEFTSANSDKKCLVKESSHSESDSILERSVVTNSGSADQANDDMKPVICKSRTSHDSFQCKVESVSPVGGRDGSLENGFNTQQNVAGLRIGGLTSDNTASSEDPMEVCVKFPAVGNADNNVRLLSCRNSVPNASILKHRNGLNIGIRDDDENFSRYNKPGTKPRAFRHPSRIGDRRIRKLLTSKYWKAAPKLRDCEVPKVAYLDGGMRPFYRKRKTCYNRDKYQRDILYKRRKFSDRSLVVTSDGVFSSESVCNSPEKSLHVDKNGLAATFHGEHGSSSTVGHQFKSKDSHVKFSIKSFRIPELFIEVPETATVGSLKRTVMETVQAILGGGLRVGVVLHGKKVRDDNRTLSQTGITSEVDLDTLGFTLEPSSGKAPLIKCTEDSPYPLACDTSHLVSRSPATPVLDSGISDSLPDTPPLTILVDNIDNNHELAAPYTDKLTDNTLSDSRALVPVPPVSVDPLSVVPVNHKSKRSEIVQRRTRRPFSVTEVEALVQAVEELGTGRWRDVKLRSFEDADHRTYVDLKDKWKTLVHTAKIAPQQRRGEPVPQELLDRVLAAHAYWSQYQAKQHNKNQNSVSKIIEHGGRNGVEGMVM